MFTYNKFTLLLKSIFSESVFDEKPPVFVDLGASGEPLKEWKCLAKYSVCLAFDADDREFSVSSSNPYGWKKQYLFNRLVSDESERERPFYLTKSPFCSSQLKPDSESLSAWAFGELFEMERTVSLPSINLLNALKSINLDNIDWYKSDTQGTDLRIFKSLPQSVQDKILVAEFEPGIIDAYNGEDKLFELISYMNNKNFWVSSMNIKGSQRLNWRTLSEQSKIAKFIFLHSQNESPGWCEIGYINNIVQVHLDYREFLLTWVFATIKKQHGFGYEIAKIGLNKFHKVIFRKLENYSYSQIFKPNSIMLNKIMIKIIKRLNY